MALASGRARSYSSEMRKGAALLVSAVISMLGPRVATAHEGHPHILFLSSYHSSFPTFLPQVRGIEDIVSPLDATLEIEAMDAKRFPARADIDAFRTALAAKLRRLPEYDAVLLGDDHALRLYLEDRELFGKAFAVFFGVNDRALATSLEGDYGLAGVVEDISALETLEAMARLNPSLERTWIVTDDTPAGIADSARVMEIGVSLDGRSLYRLDLSAMTMEELEGTLRGLDPYRDSVLLLSAAGDSTGRRFDFFDSLERIATAAAAPVYHLWEHGMGYGLAGGRLVSQREQARRAASIAMGRLKGEPLGGRSIVLESPNAWVFDASVLRRFGIAEGSLPRGSRVLNGRLERIARVAPFAAAIAGEMAIIFLLLWNGLKRRKAQVALGQALAEKDMLLKEIHHRVKNNLAVISALLRLQEEELTDSRAQAALVMSRSRIQSMAALHNELYREGTCARVNLRRYVESIIASVRGLYGADRVRTAVTVDPPSVALGIDDLMPVGLILNEACVNACKHAIAQDDRGGTLLVAASVAEGRACIRIADDGPGFPALSPAGRAGGLGMQLMTELASQLHGTIAFSNLDGAVIHLDFPLSEPESQGRAKETPSLGARAC